VTGLDARSSQLPRILLSPTTMAGVFTGAFSARGIYRYMVREYPVDCLALTDGTIFSYFCSLLAPLLSLPCVPCIQQRHAHENPVIFYSVVLGSVGPVMLFTVPPIRKSLGYTSAPPIPTSYPGESPSFVLPSHISGRLPYELSPFTYFYRQPVPQRARVPVQGYDDE
jgi:hypothetical protein